jgi:hypothetical protein
MATPFRKLHEKCRSVDAGQLAIATMLLAVRGDVWIIRAPNALGVHPSMIRFTGGVPC